jgi:hypothetical protein
MNPYWSLADAFTRICDWVYDCGFSRVVSPLSISGDVGSSSGRRPVFGAERHPSMHIAAQIASATSLGMVGPAASAAAVGNSGSNGSGGENLPSILEVDVNTSDVMADGGPASVRAFKVEIEEH